MQKIDVSGSLGNGKEISQIGLGTGGITVFYKDGSSDWFERPTEWIA